MNKDVSPIEKNNHFLETNHQKNMGKKPTRSHILFTHFPAKHLSFGGDHLQESEGPLEAAGTVEARWKQPGNLWG